MVNSIVTASCSLSEFKTNKNKCNLFYLYDCLCAASFKKAEFLKVWVEISLNIEDILEMSGTRQSPDA